MLITYQLTADDIVAGQVRFREGSSGFHKFLYYALPIGLSFLLGALGILEIALFRSYRSTGVICLCLAAFLLVSRFYQRTSYGRRYIRKNPSVAREYKAEFTERGVELWGPDLHVKSGWSNFQLWQESENHFLLYPSSRTFHLFPKRSFELKDVDAFRALLSQKVAPRSQSLRVSTLA